MNADHSLFVMDLYERRSNSTNLVWSIASDAKVQIQTPEKLAVITLKF